MDEELADMADARLLQEQLRISPAVDNPSLDDSRSFASSGGAWRSSCCNGSCSDGWLLQVLSGGCVLALVALAVARWRSRGCMNASFFLDAVAWCCTGAALAKKCPR